ncbi:MAG: formate dehydrogenase [Pseudomonadota bacterium]
MSDSTADRSKPADTAQALKRRGLLIGAGAAGAAVLAVKALPGAAPAATTAAVIANKVVDTKGGYQVTDHVLRYYETTRA